MPIYEYQCDGCSEVFEVYQKHSDPPPAQHSCGSTQMHRVLSNTSFVLKGTGWYATDYGNKSTGDGEGGSHKKHKKTDEKTSDAPDKKDADKKNSGGSSSESGSGSSSSSSGSTGPAPSSGGASASAS